MLRHSHTATIIEFVCDKREAKRFFWYVNFKLYVFCDPWTILGKEALVLFQDVKLAVKKFHNVDIVWIESHLMGV